MTASTLDVYRAQVTEAVHNRADANARRISAGQVALIRKGERGLFGIAYAGEVLATCHLGADALDVLAERAMEIAHEIRTERRPAPLVEIEPVTIMVVSPPDPVLTAGATASVAPPAPDWAIVARVKNRAVIDRLRDRYQLPKVA